MTGLELVSLGRNRIKDIHPLSLIKNLTVILAAGNAIQAPALSDLPRLYYLDLSGNHISDLSLLSGLPRLEYLNLSNNRLSDLSPWLS